MLRAIELGKNALGNAAPNPMVGCCIVYEDHIIGEGYTDAYGGPHAEVNAIQSVKDKSLLEKATLYVTLEPCSHFGKTPPCSDLIIRCKIPRVVIGLKDPHSKVSGRGIERLKSSGISVHVGLLEDACREHHKRFLTFQEKHRPYIILKWAESTDAFIAPLRSRRSADPQPFWITNKYSKQQVHQWRTQEQGILIGTQTVLEDNPKLNARFWKGKHPTRVVLDRSLRIPSNSHVFDGSVKTIVLTEIKGKENLDNLIFEVIDFKKGMVEQICQVLVKHNIISVIVEGGTKTLQSFIDSGLWDEARIFVGEATFSSGIPAPKISGKPISKTSLLNDTLTILRHD